MLCVGQVVADITKDQRLLDRHDGGTMILGNVMNYTSKNVFVQNEYSVLSGNTVTLN
jgi:hypothetical protein